MVSVVFFGTPTFALSAIERLMASRHRVVGVVTQPDRPRGRGQQLSEPPVKRIARASGLPVLQPEQLKDLQFLVALAALKADLGVVAAYGRILPDEVLHTPRLGLINIHASLLPRYRGAAPVHRAVMAGESQTGVTILQLVSQLDAGPILASVARPIGPEETSEEIEHDLARLGAELVIPVIDDLVAGRMHPILQDERLATYAPRLTRADGLIDWSRPARVVHNQVRGLHPWPRACAYLGRVRYVIFRTALRETAAGADRAPGQVLQADGDDLIVAAGGGTALAILQLQLEGRRPMSTREFLAGHPIRPGSTFTASPSPVQ